MPERLLAPLAAVALSAGLAAGQEAPPPHVAEVEPNDAASDDLAVLPLGRTWTGRLEAEDGRDADLIALEVAEPTRVDVRWRRLDGETRGLSGWLRLDRRGQRGRPQVSLRGEAVDLLGFTLPAGRSILHVGARQTDGVPYEVRVTRAPAEGAEVEPNDREEDADRLALGAPRRAWVSHAARDVDHFVLDVPAAGVYRLRFELPPAERPDPPLELALGIDPEDDGRAYTHRLDRRARTFAFYPVLAAGEHRLVLTTLRGEVGAGYTIEAAPFSAEVTPELRGSARTAIDRGLAWLLDRDPRDDRAAREVAALGAALAALGEGSGASARADDRRSAVAEGIERLRALQEEADGGRWAGEPVRRFGRATLYGQSIATLALAECAAAGHEEARALCADGVRLLLASQLSPRRPAPWGACAEDAPDRGGWRYQPGSSDADLSVAGWCAIALFAADVAGVEVPGVVTAVEEALDYAVRCSGEEDGFRYTVGAGRSTSTIQQGIGALLCLLFDRRPPALDPALADLDRHLCAGTEAADGHDSPFYYWYYATRVHFLRGGDPWRRWRSVALTQLVARQEEDGSWAALREERPGGRRYATGLAILVLRLCLGEPPAYLSREVEAF